MSYIISEQSLAVWSRCAVPAVESLFVQAGHTKLIEFGTTLELAEKRGDEWILTLHKDIPGKDKDIWRQETFDALVVASGHYYVPFIPKIPGLLEYDQRFPGRTRHSKHYRSPEPSRNKRVVVVGGGATSAIGVLPDIKDAAQKPVFASLRRASPSPRSAGRPSRTRTSPSRRKPARFDPDPGVSHLADGHVRKSDVDAAVSAPGCTASRPALHDAVLAAPGEQERLAEARRGEACFFEALRAVAGGVLPPFDKRWLRTFEEAVEVRLGWWRGEAVKARL